MVAETLDLQSVSLEGRKEPLPAIPDNKKRFIAIVGHVTCRVKGAVRDIVFDKGGKKASTLGTKYSFNLP